MTTPPDERLPYLDLARQGARVSRSVQPERLRRLDGIAPGRGPLHVDMTFDLDGHARPWVSGTVEVTVAATCQRCLEQFDHQMRERFELCITRDPEQASELAAEADVLVVEADAVSVADVVEDELILGLPERLCTETPCPHAPAMEYPAKEPNPADDDNPFRVLSKLRQR